MRSGVAAMVGVYAAMSVALPGCAVDLGGTGVSSSDEQVSGVTPTGGAPDAGGQPPAEREPPDESQVVEPPATGSGPDAAPPETADDGDAAPPGTTDAAVAVDGGAQAPGGCGAQPCVEELPLSLRARFNRHYTRAYPSSKQQFGDWFRTRRQTLGGVTFDVARSDERFHGVAVGGEGPRGAILPIGTAVSRFSFLLAGQGTGCAGSFELELRYEGDTQRVVRVPAPDWRAGCEGAVATLPVDRKQRARLYLRGLNNPLPELSVASIRLRAPSDGALFVAAVTLVAAPPACTPGDDAEEVCNGLDDDCDGQVDEDACPRGCRGRALEAQDLAFCVDPAPWVRAEQVCRSVGMALATVDGVAQDSALRQFWRDDARPVLFWVGGSDADEEGWWTWRDGRPFWQGEADGLPVDGRYAAWRDGEPNDAGDDEDCAEVRAAGWNDAQCERERPFVCSAPRPRLE